MAVVGSASVLVRFITAGAAQQLKKDLTGVSTSARSAGGSVGKSFVSAFNAEQGGVFKKLGSGFKSIEGPARAARERLQSLVRISNFLSPAIIGVVGAVGALGGVLVTLVGVLAAAGPALGVVAGGFVTLGIAAIGAKIGLSGIGAAVSKATKQNGALGKSIAVIREELQQLGFDAEAAANAESRAALNLEVARENLIRVQDLPPNSRARREAQLGYEEAELAFRRAKDNAADLQKQQKDGVVPSSIGGDDPFAGLNASQKAFAQYLISLKPLFDELENRISKGFIPSLISGFKRVETELLRTEDFETAIDNFGLALGRAGQSFFNGILDNGGGQAVIDILEMMSAEGGSIETLGAVLGNVFGIFLQLLVAAQPVITALFGDLEKGTSGSLANLKGLNENGDLTKTFGDSYAILKQLVGILGLFLSGFGALGTAATSSGAAGALLTWLETVGTGFAGLGENEEFKKTLAGATDNGIILLQIIGDILGFILELGARPEIGAFLQGLRDLGPQFGTLFNSFLEGLPGLLELIENLVGIGNALTADGALTSFFDTLNLIAGTIKDVLETKQAQDFIGALFPVLQIFNAISLAGTLLLNYVLLPIIGVLFTLATPILLLRKGLSLIGVDGIKLGKFFGGIGTFIKGVFMGLFTLIKTILIGIGTAIRVAFATNPLGAIITVIALVIAALVYFFSQTEIGKKIWQGFVDFISGLIGNIGAFFTGLGESISESFGRTVENLKLFWDGFVGFFQDAVGNIGGFFETVFNNIKTFFKDVINNLIGFAEGFVNFWIKGLNFIISKINEIQFEVPDWVPLIGGNKLGFNLPLLSEIQLPRLAKGGVVLPQSGGQIVTVAEAGRPERIEPLDPSGLSRRDRALIQVLSGAENSSNKPSVVNTINVYATPGMDAKELAEEVSRRIAFKVRKGAF